MNGFADFHQDLRYAARGLRKNPGFAAAAIVTVALGIGAATAIFSVTDTVLLKPLPYRDPGRLMLIEASNRKLRVEHYFFSYNLFDRLRHETRESFEDMAAVMVPRTIMPREDGSPELTYRAFATTNFLEMMGARVMLGRGFNSGDARPVRFDPMLGAPPGSVAILAYDYWRSRYGGNPSVIGQEVRMYGHRGPRIVGVLAPGFHFSVGTDPMIANDPQIWIAYNLEYPPDSHAVMPVDVVGRLKPEVGLKGAQQQLDRVAENGIEFRATPVLRKMVAEVRPAIQSLMGAVLFLLLIACSNVANLLLSRATLRERELAVRAALGGGWSRLVRQMLTESLLVSVCGAVLGVAFAWAGLRELLAIAPANLPRVESAGIDWRVLGFTIAATVTSAIIFGIMPALRAARPDVIRVFRGRTRAEGGTWLRSFVVVAEVALSFVLLIGSGLMARTFVELHRLNPGFDAHGVLTVMIFRDWDWSQPQEKRMVLLAAIRDRLKKIPGVENVSEALALPLNGGQIGPGIPWTVGSQTGLAESQGVLPGYFETLGTKLIAGRTFDESDIAVGRSVVIVDDLFASRIFPNRSAVGQRVDLWRPGFEIIGVVEHQRQASLTDVGREQMYVVDGREGLGLSRQWAIRTSGDPMALVPAVREALKEVDPMLLPREIQPMSAIVEQAQSGTRFALLLISVFAAVAAMLAAVGLYGVLATAVRQRTCEIGIRMALGAEPRSILAKVAGEGLKLSAAGIAIGIIAALGATRAMASLLVGVKAADPTTFAAVAMIFLFITVAACSIPARRAARIDPMAALRDE